MDILTWLWSIESQLVKKYFAYILPFCSVYAKVLYVYKLFPLVQAVHQVCPHHIGHYLGLDVHDTSTVPYSRKLEPNMVFPLEPGVYMRPELQRLGVPEKFIGIGMRLEDDYVLNAAGAAERLSNRLPQAASQLEEIVRAGPKTMTGQRLAEKAQYCI